MRARKPLDGSDPRPTERPGNAGQDELFRLFDPHRLTQFIHCSHISRSRMTWYEGAQISTTRTQKAKNGRAALASGLVAQVRDQREDRQDSQQDSDHQNRRLAVGPPRAVQGLPDRGAFGFLSHLDVIPARLAGHSPAGVTGRK